ncbi:MAG TPA: pilus assembly protein PilM [Phycisphaerales bacterium]|nr:pilus assembly protein PilM [Phycisphaerales bacterium]HRQ75803.1 pilus assembly protein PilM [Phycisphaerales bacterium]
MPQRNAIAIDIGRHRLRALLADRDGGILRVRKVVQEDLPEDLPADDPERVGSWIAEALKNAGFPRDRAVLALAREHVSLKRLTLPTADERELPEMTRLAMQRELPFDAAAPGAAADGAVIDFIPVARTETSTTVLAVAVRRSTLDHALRIARAARLRVERISLRAMGAAMLMRHLVPTGETNGRARQSVLAVDIAGDAVEFCVVDASTEGGAVRFSRAAEIYKSQFVEELAESVITETRRTWMSYRIGDDTSDVRHVIVMGGREVASEVAPPVSEMLQAEAEVLSSHPLVDAGRLPGGAMDHMWPLAGLLLEDAAETRIDLAHPRRAPDRAAERRKRMLYAAGIGALVVLSLFTLGRRELAGMRLQAESLTERARQLQPKYERYFRDEYKWKHIDLWESAGVDWLEHINYLAMLSPAPAGVPDAAVVLDNWHGAMKFDGVRFDRRRPSGAEFFAPRQVTIDVKGEARDRATADAFRDALVRTAVYTTSSTGADAGGGRRLPFGFAYRLRLQNEAAMMEGGEEPDDATNRAEGEAR